MLDVDEIPEHPSVGTFASFCSGLIGGLAGLAVGHPFDTVKVRLQSRELASRYKGTLNCFVTIVRQERVFGLYKGMASPAAGVSAVNALVFGSYTWLLDQQAQSRSGSPRDPNPPLLDVLFAGMGAGLITSFVTCPMELVKVQLQSQTEFNSVKSGLNPPFRGPIDCLTKMYAQGGLRLCFKGMVPTALRELSFGPYFLAYECIAHALSSPGQPAHELTGAKVIVAGGTAGIAAWCSTYFADVIKTRIQAEPHRYRGIIDCTIKCYREEGWRIFFRGLTPTILRAFPSNASTFMAYSWTMQLFAARGSLARRDEALI